MRDERFDLLLLKQIEERDQILPEHFRFYTFKPLNAVRNHPFAAREKPTASNVQSEDGDGAKTLTTPGRA